MKQPMEHQAAAVEARRQGGKEAGGQLPRPLSPAKRKLKSCNRCDAHSLPEPPGLRLSRTTGTETLTQRSAILSRLLFSRGPTPLGLREPLARGALATIIAKCPCIRP